MEVSIDEPLNVDWDGNELLLSDILGTDEDVIYKDLENEVENVNCCVRQSAKLGRTGDEQSFELQIRTGKLHTDSEMTQKEVADYLGISQSYISRLEKKIMKRLKKEMVKE